MGLCVIRVSLCDIDPLAFLWEYIVSDPLFSCYVFIKKHWLCSPKNLGSLSLQLCPLTVWPWQKQSHLATRAKGRKRCTGKLSNTSVRVSARHEGAEEEGEKSQGLRISTNFKLKSSRGETKNV